MVGSAVSNTHSLWVLGGDIQCRCYAILNMFHSVRCYALLNIVHSSFSVYLKNLEKKRPLIKNKRYDKVCIFPERLVV